MARETGWTPDFIRWELPFVDVLRYRAAALYLEGYTLRRAGLAGLVARHKRRARVDAALQKYARG